MDSRLLTRLYIAVVTVTLLGFVCFGQENDKAVNAASSGETEQITWPAFPYPAQITVDNVYVRSGPGTNYYRCGKIQQGDVVKVISKKNAWSQIVPTAKSFSWISKQYVVIDTSNPDIGVVTGDNVRVYAGSVYHEPIHSDKVQLKLNKGDKVTLLGEEAGDYYKIKPPSGAYFWVSTQYTRPKGISSAVVKKPVEPEAKPVVKPEPTLPEPTVVPTTLEENSERLKQFYQLQASVKAEFKKPLAEQDYSKAKNQLQELIKSDDSDKAARYAEFVIRQVERFELAASVDKESKLQNSQLSEIINKIDNAHSERVSEFRDLGRFAAIGKIKTSNVYGPEVVLLHYTVVGRNNKIICYALPAGPAGHIDLKNYIGKKVGLIGKIEPHPQTSGALIRFAEIEILD